MKNLKISKAVIRRLPRYRRYLIDLNKKGVEKISSKEFSNLVGCTASQIRQDLNNFGDFGQQGYGYSVKELCREIGLILGLDKEYRMIVVGAGDLGRAIARYAHRQRACFDIYGIFDIDPAIIGKKVDEFVIMDYTNVVGFIRKMEISLGIICVGPENAQEVADRLTCAGVKGIWNFAPIDIAVPGYVALESVHLTDSLHSLVYNMNSISKKGMKEKLK